MGVPIRKDDKHQCHLPHEHTDISVVIINKIRKKKWRGTTQTTITLRIGLRQKKVISTNSVSASAIPYRVKQLIALTHCSVRGIRRNRLSKVRARICIDVKIVEKALNAIICKVSENGEDLPTINSSKRMLMIQGKGEQQNSESCKKTKDTWKWQKVYRDQKFDILAPSNNSQKLSRSTRKQREICGHRAQYTHYTRTRFSRKSTVRCWRIHVHLEFAYAIFQSYHAI